MLGVQNRGHSQPEFQNHTLCISNRNASGVINGHFMEAWNPLVGWNQRPMKTTWRHAKKQKPWRGHDIEMIWSVGLLRVNLKIFYIQGCRVSTWLPDHSRSPSCASPQLHKIVGLHAVCCPHACIYSSCKCSFSFKLHQTMHACFYASACTQFFFRMVFLNSWFPMKKYQCELITWRTNNSTSPHPTDQPLWEYPHWMTKEASISWPAGPCVRSMPGQCFQWRSGVLTRMHACMHPDTSRNGQ